MLVTVITLLFSFSFLNVFANSYRIEDFYVYLGGETIGIETQAGLEVVGIYSIAGITPAIDAGIEKQDVLLTANGFLLNEVADLKDIIEDNEEMVLEVKRDEEVFTTKIKRVLETNNEYSVGMFLKERILGVGTLTYLVPDTFKFGALGHSLTNNLGKTTGTIYETELKNIVKGAKGTPGEKQATLLDRVGLITSNTITGIHGRLNTDSLLLNKKLVKVARQTDIGFGEAYIVTSVDKGEKDYYRIEIIDIDYQSNKDTKGIKFKVVDEELLAKTGGIIKGMSGSPIIQNNRLIGAVTHVLLNDPTSGYGVHIEFMLMDNGIFLTT